MAPSVDAANALVSWLCSEGGRVHTQVQVGLDAYGGYGLFASALTAYTAAPEAATTISVTSAVTAIISATAGETVNSVTPAAAATISATNLSATNLSATRAPISDATLSAATLSATTLSATTLSATTLSEPASDGASELPVETDLRSCLVAEEELFAIPRRCMLECPEEVVDPSHQQPALALSLIRELSLGASSHWAPFMSVLPSPQEMSRFMLLMHDHGGPDGGARGEGLEGNQGAEVPQHCNQPHMHAHGGGGGEGLEGNQRGEGPQPGPGGGRVLQFALAASPTLASAFERKQLALRAEYRCMVPQLLKEFPSLRSYPMNVSTTNATAASLEPPPLGLYRWARCVVASRAIHLWRGPTLVPVADFMNHRYPPSVVCMARNEGEAQEEEAVSKAPARRRRISGLSYSSDDSIWLEDSSEESEDEPQVLAQPVDPGTQYFCAHAIRDVQPGSELLWVYNAHRHDVDWLLGYGFIPDDGRTSHPHVDEPCAPVQEGTVAEVVVPELAVVEVAVAEFISHVNEANAPVDVDTVAEVAESISRVNEPSAPVVEGTAQVDEFRERFLKEAKSMQLCGWELSLLTFVAREHEAGHILRPEGGHK
eukprot:gene25554-11202_t